MTAVVATPAGGTAGAAGFDSPIADGDVSLLCSVWLDQVRSQFPLSLRCLALMRVAGQERLQLAAVRPHGAALDDLQPALEQAVRSSAAQRIDVGGKALLCAPVIWERDIRGVVAVELPDSANADAALQRLVLASGWLVALAARLGQHADKTALNEARRVLQLIAATMAEATFKGACLALTDRLASAWRADAVMIGWVDTQAVTIVARSNASQSDERANLLRLAGAAMDEALDLRQTVQFCARTVDPPINLPEHRAYAREAGCDAVATSLLFDRGAPVGAVLLERRTACSADELETLDTQCMMLAPLLARRRESEQSLLQHARLGLRHVLKRAGDDSMLGWKAGSAIAALALLAAAFVPAPLRITAPAVVEGEVQRVVAAPFQGFISDARSRAGDIVRKGQVLATLDDKDLLLDRAKWSADLEVAQRKEREALAASNRVEMRLAAAQANQASAQLGLAEQKLERVQLTAPFDGVIVRGDLSQQLGSPVEQGKVLFEIAPLDAWRVIVKVDERDVAWLRNGQQGELMLAGLSGVRHAFDVKQVTAIAVAEEGRNHFRVEAQLKRHDIKLRPGMEGVAKVEAGEASALWVATRRLADWLRLTLWEWAP